MRNLRLLPVLFGFIFFLSSCNEDSMCMEGEGDVETRTLDLSQFDGVEANGSMRVFIRKGSPQRVEVKGQPNVLDALKTEVTDGVWSAEFDRCVRHYEEVQVYITVPELRETSIGGTGYVELEDVFESEEFIAAVTGSGDLRLKLAAKRLTSRIDGSGTITATGDADQHDLTIWGSGNNNSFELMTKETQAVISGSGKAEVSAEEQLDVEIGGSGRVYYQGSPSVDTEVSGSGEVIKK